MLRKSEVLRSWGLTGYAGWWYFCADFQVKEVEKVMKRIEVGDVWYDGDLESSWACLERAGVPGRWPFLARWREFASSPGYHEHPFTLAVVLYLEARGEDLVGRTQVVQVVINRARAKYMGDIDAALLAARQFSSLWSINHGAPGGRHVDCDLVWGYLREARATLEGLTSGSTLAHFPTANMYCTEMAALDQFKRYLRGDVRAWDWRLITVLGRIGGHVFFRGEL